MFMNEVWNQGIAVMYLLEYRAMKHTVNIPALL